ncbi:DUF309 domain-containing protein [Salinicoccus albus]|uniref:DUF309 domain-containing protein n=1 Tax=Salinicoccus albus TaxID=418756 RepID=UPI00036E9558|nr:DUF309 domain-containing protein [Salinicoccus albus]
MKLSVLLEFYNELIIKQDYFECHEIMEDAWNEKQVRTKEDPEVFLIKIAVAEYHYRRQNIKGAEKLMERALKLYNDNQYDLDELGLDSDVICRITSRKNHIREKSFEPMIFPLKHSVLYQLYAEYGTHSSFDEFERWAETYENNDEFIIHKHLLRNKDHVHESGQNVLKKRKHLK